LIKNPHWIKERPKPGKYRARIRQVGELLSCKLSYKKQFKITLNKPITGVSEGQAIVIYRGKEVMGGGVIGF
jgi:tRNA U34 2-thiouridine synthase MnmA/TrmU